jgi:hypothetical protein
MRTSFTFVATIALLGIVGDSFAQADNGPPISFSNLKSKTPGENSSLSGECERTTKSNEITCRFTQLMIRLQLDPKQLAAETEKRLAEARAEFVKDPTKLSAELCAVFKKDRAEFERMGKEIKNPHTLRYWRAWFNTCANPSLSTVEEFLRQGALLESKTCVVSQFQNNPVTYKRIGTNKWVANVGPEGACNSVFLYTMEREPQYSNLWTWSQVRTYADSSGPLCKGLRVNEKIEFSWRGNDPDLVCEAIKFGN